MCIITVIRFMGTPTLPTKKIKTLVKQHCCAAYGNHANQGIIGLNLIDEILNNLLQGKGTLLRVSLRFVRKYTVRKLHHTK
jgi:hypothetical protein